MKSDPLFFARQFAGVRMASWQENLLRDIIENPGKRFVVRLPRGGRVRFGEALRRAMENE
jgi:hypothetical protein